MGEGILMEPTINYMRNSQNRNNLVSLFWYGAHDDGCYYYQRYLLIDKSNGTLVVSSIKECGGRYQENLYTITYDEFKEILSKEQIHECVVYNKVRLCDNTQENPKYETLNEENWEEWLINNHFV